MSVSPPCDVECRNSFRYEIMPLAVAVALTTITHTKKDKNCNAKQVQYLPKSWENISKFGYSCILSVRRNGDRQHKPFQDLHFRFSSPCRLLRRYEKDESTAVIRRLSVHIIGLVSYLSPASRWMAPRPSVRSETCSRWWQKSYHSEPPLPHTWAWWLAAGGG